MTQATATCPGCRAMYDVTGRPVGTTLPCPGCGGTIVVPEPVAAPEEAVFERARSKLARARQDHGLPIGANIRRTVVVAILCGLPFLLFATIAMLVRDGTGVLVFAVCLLILLEPIALISYVRSLPHRPARALKDFYRCVARGDHRRAYALVADADKDGQERHQPEHVADLGRPSWQPMLFSRREGFQRYWREMLRARTWPICYATVRGLRIEEHAPDLAVATFDLTVKTNTSLYALGILAGIPGILVCLIIQSATYKTVQQPMQRVLVRVGEEWRLFNGEWQGWEEADLRWLDG